MKLLVHNHTGEFEKLADSPRTSFDILVEETDPALVTMQLDLGWTYIAGIDPIALFKAHPGRFELWHVKDVFGLKTVNPSLGPNARVSSMAHRARGHRAYRLQAGVRARIARWLEAFRHRAGQRGRLGRLARRRARLVSKPGGNAHVVAPLLGRKLEFLPQPEFDPVSDARAELRSSVDSARVQV